MYSNSYPRRTLMSNSTMTGILLFTESKGQRSQDYELQKCNSVPFDLSDSKHQMNLPCRSSLTSYAVCEFTKFIPPSVRDSVTGSTSCATKWTHLIVVACVKIGKTLATKVTSVCNIARTHATFWIGVGLHLINKIHYCLHCYPRNETMN